MLVWHFLLSFVCFRERDSNKDRVLDFQEFFHGIYDLIRNYEDPQHDGDESDDSHEVAAKILFNQLDRDGSG